MTSQLLKRASIVGAVLVAIGCGGPKQDATAAPATKETPATTAAPATAGLPAGQAGTATISGAIEFSGTPPAGTKVKMDADPVCQLQHAQGRDAEEVVVSNGKLANVFVYVKSGLEGQTFPAPTTPVSLDQQGCWYLPHVLGIQVNQPLEILNSDQTLHNINVKPTKNQPFNIAQPVKGMKTSKKFTKPEVMIKTKCNVHPWMSAYIGVLDHPFFAVTGADGAFTMSGLPAGTYTVEAWHEKFGAKTESVTLADGESKSASFTFP